MTYPRLLAQRWAGTGPMDSQLCAVPIRSIMRRVSVNIGIITSPTQYCLATMKTIIGLVSYDETANEVMATVELPPWRRPE